MKICAGILAVPLPFLVTACAPVQPKPDPLREEVAILQKQLLELQKIQIETRARLDESTAAVNTLSVKIVSLEELQSTRTTGPAAQLLADSAVPVPHKSVKNATIKTNKNVRRQE